MAWLSAIPALYQLGMWRVQYLQSVCCVCRLRKTKTLFSVATFQHDKYNHLSALVCSSCHKDSEWLPQPIQQEMPNQQQISSKQGVLSNIQATLDIEGNRETPSFPPFLITSAAPHTGYLRAAIIAFKYREQLPALPVLVYAIQQLPKPKGCYRNNSAILAVPTTNKRLAKRGFDPVMIMAYYLSQHWHIPIWHGAIRVDDTVSQQGLDKHQRQQNMHNAFRITSHPPCTHIILFDDVVTTGATLSSLALTLKTAYPAIKLSAYCISRGH